MKPAADIMQCLDYIYLDMPSIMMLGTALGAGFVLGALSAAMALGRYVERVIRVKLPL